MQKLRQCMHDLWGFFKTSMGLYMQHTYASHVLRVMIEIMGGVKVTDRVIRSRMSNHFKKGTLYRVDTVKQLQIEICCVEFSF